MNSIMQIHTYRTVNTVHEWREAFPIFSIRFPSKSLQRHVLENTHRYKHTENKSIKGLVTFMRGQFVIFSDIPLTASSVWAFLGRCHPTLSGSCSTKPCQSDKKKQKKTVLHISSSCSDTFTLNRGRTTLNNNHFK